MSTPVALVTGGRDGAGRAICERFVNEGYHVYAADLRASGSISTDNPEDLPGEFVSLDVTDEANVASVMEQVSGEHGQLNVLVNAAGIEIEATVEDTSLEQFNHLMAINVTGTFLTSKYALPLLRNASNPSIINFGSYDGFIADPKLAAYCASKGAVHALTKAMACDHGPEGIRVNSICPGYIDTPTLEQFIPEGVDPEAARPRPRPCIHFAPWEHRPTWRTWSTGWRRTKPTMQPVSCGCSTVDSPHRSNRCASNSQGNPSFRSQDLQHHTCGPTD